uniref:Uncharacterized protein n=1 Tax=Salix viminalis TaxID=40686 RepID=A0A6N2M2J1_SALVM
MAKLESLDVAEPTQTNNNVNYNNDKKKRNHGSTNKDPTICISQFRSERLQIVLRCNDYELVAYCHSRGEEEAGVYPQIP